MKNEKHSEKNVTVQLATLKLNLEACETRLANALIYPETREAVHQALLAVTALRQRHVAGIGGQWGIETKLYGNLLVNQSLSCEQYYLAARQQDYDQAFKAYDEFLDEALQDETFAIREPRTAAVIAACEKYFWSAIGNDGWQNSSSPWTETDDLEWKASEKQ